MGILSIVLLVFFVAVSVLLVLMVLFQTEEGDNLGGIFAGGGGSAFGSRAGNVLTRVTTVLGVLYLVVSFSLALLNRTPGGTGVEAAGRELSGETGSSNWLETELNPELPFEIEGVDPFQGEGSQDDTVSQNETSATESPETGE
jgi:preprotein translocase subunit SecG